MSFVYTPNIRYNEISEKDNDAIEENLSTFRRGYLEVLESHLTNSDNLHSFLNSQEVSAEIRNEIRDLLKDIERELMSIVRLFSDLKEKIAEDNLNKEAKKSYFSFFESPTMQDNELAFVAMMLIYLALSSFNTRVEESWNYLRKVFENLPANPQHKSFLEKVLILRIYPRIELCQQTSLLLRRLAFVLGIDANTSRGKYIPDLTYGMELLFFNDIENFLEKEEEKEVIQEQPEVTDKIDSSIKNPYFLDARGKQLFNQSDIFILNIDKVRMKEHEKKIINCKYVETHLYAGAEKNKQKLILSLATKKTSNHLTEYENFLKEYFSHVRKKILIDFYFFSEREKKLLLYHFSPTYFYKFTLSSFLQDHTGFIHRRRSSQKMIRELPYEYVKYFLQEWWNENIYMSSSRSDRNSPEIIQTISKNVYQQWQKEKSIMRFIKHDATLLRAFQLRDYHTLNPFLEAKLSTLPYLLFLRFLGHDFLYLDTQEKAQNLLAKRL